MAFEIGGTAAEIIYQKSLYMKNWMKKDIRGRKPIFANEQFDYSKDNQIGMQPIDRSLFLLMPLSYPEIYMLHPNSYLRKCMRGLINYICQATRAVSGFQDVTLGKEVPIQKTAFLNIPMFTTQANPTTELSFTIPTELSGYFVIEMLRHWMSAISDENSKVAHYNNLDIEFNNYSHSAAMAYIKPNKTWNKVEYGCLIFMMVPLTAQTSNFNSDATAPGITELEIPFTACIIDNRNVRVRDMLDSVLAAYKQYTVIDSNGYGADGTGTFFGMLDEATESRIMDNVRKYAVA